MATVIYQVVVSGKTFGADVQLMRKVLKSQFQDQVEFVESSTDHQVTVLLCPICSRIGSDVDAAVSEVKGKGKIEMVIACVGIYFLSSVVILLSWIITVINILMYW